MGYSNDYSAVYFGRSFLENLLIKIGETGNPNRRGDELMTQNGIAISLIYSIEGGKPERKLIEDYLRIQILRTGHARQYKEDYFYCNSEETISLIENSFEDWVKEAQQFINNIPYQNYGLYGRIPITPKYEKWLWHICKDLETISHYQTHFQCTHSEEERLLTMFCETFAPSGFRCEMTRKCTWVYLTITK